MPALLSPLAAQTLESPRLQTVSSSSKAHGKPSAGAKKKKPAQGSKAARMESAAQLKQAFVASSELRPMAQQLIAQRSPAAYAGVVNYARLHTGEAAAAAYLALGRASMLDKKWSEAITYFEQARKSGVLLDDYAEFLEARAAREANENAQARSLLHGFALRHPDSVFVDQAPELEAEALLAMNDAQEALATLNDASSTAASTRLHFQLMQGETALRLNDTQSAARIFKRVLLTRPLSQDAQAARNRLNSLGMMPSLTAAEQRTLADAYYNAGRYAEAAEQYRALGRRGGFDDAARNSFMVAAAACDLKLKSLTLAEAQALPDTSDESGARRLYLLMELARNRGDQSAQKSVVEQMKSRFPGSPWLAEALFSSGNMYLLKRDYEQAADYYSTLASRFPTHARAATAHWRAGWLYYRLGRYPDAARLFDAQIRLYSASHEASAALYWRARLYETMDHKPAQAIAYYRNLIRVYPHYYYTQQARLRLAALGESTASSVAPATGDGASYPAPSLVDEFPTASPHLAKARLLANAGLNEYIADEIAADPASSSWSALAEAQIYASYGEHFRALRAIKKALPGAASAPIKSVPLAYWRILFPEPWWETIKAEAARNHLDPYLVASLMRQESEFNPAAVSRANAYGLMQMLPSVGKSMAREEGMGKLETYQLLDPATNIRLGTRYLRRTLDKFDGVTEYALAAYNAGDERVTEWRAAGSYQGMDEFVESIPFTETREYVQAILRNIDFYRAIDEYAATQRRGGSRP